MQYLVGLTEQLQSRILVRDLSAEDWNDPQATVWEYSSPLLREVCGLKFRENAFWGGKIVLFCSACGGGILSYKTKEMLWFSGEIGCNPHSLDVLPDGSVVTASSTDGQVTVFVPEGKTVGLKQRFFFKYAHGVLWDPKYGVVWICGDKNLGAFAVSEEGLSPVPHMQYETPSGAVHDLAPVYGDPESLFITCGAGVLRVDKASGQMSRRYPGGRSLGRIRYVAGVGNYPDGKMVCTAVIKRTLIYRAWCMNEVRFHDPQIPRTAIRKMKNEAYYKCRVWLPEYV